MKEFSREFLSSALKRKREEMGLSQKGMADLLGMKQPMYARYESGATLPSAELLFTICSNLDLSADELLGLTATQSTNINAVKSSVAVGTGAVANNCANCPLMLAASKVIKKKK